jgi:hypothetical protein
VCGCGYGQGDGKAAVRDQCRVQGAAAMNDENKDAEELMAEADLARRIAEYLQLNGFANLEEAAAKGWGDTRPLMIRPDHRDEQKH